MTKVIYFSLDRAATFAAAYGAKEDVADWRFSPAVLQKPPTDASYGDEKTDFTWRLCPAGRGPKMVVSLEGDRPVISA